VWPNRCAVKKISFSSDDILSARLVDILSVRLVDDILSTNFAKTGYPVYKFLPKQDILSTNFGPK